MSDIGTMAARASNGALVDAKRISDRPVASRRAAGSGIVIATINRRVGDTGVHAHTRSLHDGLSTVGEDVRVFSAFGGSPLWPAVFAIRRLLLDRLNPSWSTRWHRHWHRAALRRNLVAAFKQQPPAAVIAQCPLSADAALAARDRLGQRFPIITVCHFNHSEATEYREKGELADEWAFQQILDFESDVLRRIDALVYVSAFARKTVEGDRGIKPRRSVVIANGIDAGPAETPMDRRMLGLRDDDIAIINVGSLERRKNQLGLLDLFATLNKRFSRLKLLLVGDGPDRAAIEAKIVRLNLADHVLLLGFRRDVPALLSASDLYIHYATLENCPVALLEAARAGLPIASVSAGGAGELLDALGAGVVLADDEERAAQQLASLLADAAERRRVGDAASRGFARHFTRSAMVEHYLDVVRRCAADVARRPEDA